MSANKSKRYEYSSKKYMVNILRILEKFSDADHPLSRNRIAELFENEYAMKIEPKTVSRHIEDLEEMGFEIKYNEYKRKSRDGKFEDTIRTNYYLVRDITDAELRLLIDSLLFSKYIPWDSCRELIHKLEALSSEYFKARIDHVKTMPVNQPENDNIFWNIELLDEAMNTENDRMPRKVHFRIKCYGADKKLHYVLDNNGKIKEYIVSPYQMVAANSKYYLIYSHDKTDKIYHCRIDCIYDLKILDEPIRPMRELTALKDGLNLSKYMSEHIYMYSGEGKNIKFRANVGESGMPVGDILDWFGHDVRIEPESEDYVIVTVNVNEQAMLYWALQYGINVEILTPGLRNRVCKAIEHMEKVYGKP